MLGILFGENCQPDPPFMHPTPTSSFRNGKRVRKRALSYYPTPELLYGEEFEGGSPCKRSRFYSAPSFEAFRRAPLEEYSSGVGSLVELSKDNFEHEPTNRVWGQPESQHSEHRDLYGDEEDEVFQDTEANPEKWELEASAISGAAFPSGSYYDPHSCDLDWMSVEKARQDVEREHFKQRIETARDWLESERIYLIDLSRKVKRAKKTCAKLEIGRKKLEKEVAELTLKSKEYFDKVNDLQVEIKRKKKYIIRLIKYYEQVKEEKKGLRKEVNATKEKIQKAKDHYEGLKQELENVQVKFEEVGVTVKHDVDIRTDLYHQLDFQKAKLVDLAVEDSETGVDHIDWDDPLFFIESNYPFFQDVQKCTMDEIGNIENPINCLKAMEGFIQVLKDNIHRFKHLPKGPLFKCVLVKDRKWAPVVEYVLRPHLFTFLVDNIVDALVIEEIKADYFKGGRSGIINREGVMVPEHQIFPFFSNNYEIGTRITAIAGVEMENMLEGIYCEEDLWAKFLSMSINVEKILLMDNENVAFTVLSQIRDSPWECHLAYSMDGFKVYPFPNFRTKQIHLYKTSMYLKSWPNPKIGEVQSKIRRITEKIDKLNTQINSKRCVQLSIAREIDGTRLKMKNGKEYELLCKSKLKETRALIKEPLSVFEQKKQLKYLKRQLKKFRKDLTVVQQQLGEKGPALSKTKEDIIREGEALDELKMELVIREEDFFEKREEIWKWEEEDEQKNKVDCNGNKV